MSQNFRLRKIAIVAPSAYLLGGVQEWLDYLVPGLESLYWKVTVILVHGDHADSHQYLKLHPFKHAFIVKNPTGTREGRVRAVVKALRSIRPDVVLGVNIVDTYEAVERLRQEKSFKEMKVAMALHGLNPCFYEDITRLGGILDGVIATNRLAEVSAVSLAGLPGEMAHYAPCGVEIQESTPVIDNVQKLTLIFCGRFDNEEKRVMDLTQILRALERDNVEFNLSLAGAGQAESELREALSRFSDKIKFLGILDHDQKRNLLYKPGSILLILSPSETGPLVAWEAMAAGVAVVSSRFLGIGREAGLIDEVNCLTFNVGDTEAAAYSIQRLLDMKLRSKVISSALMMVRDRYSRAESVQAWHLALRRIAEQSVQTRSSQYELAIPAGRMDTLFGANVAETIRRILGLRYLHKEAGSEWPHTYGRDDSAIFKEKMAALDKIGSAK